MSSIEWARSIPTTKVVMRLTAALDTTSDEFLVGTARHEDGGWKNVTELLRKYGRKQLSLVQSFLTLAVGAGPVAQNTAGQRPAVFSCQEV